MKYMLKCKCGSVDFDTREMATDSRAYTCQRCGAFEFYDVLDDIKLVPITLVVDAIEVAVTPKPQQVYAEELKAQWNAWDECPQADCITCDIHESCRKVERVVSSDDHHGTCKYKVEWMLSGSDAATQEEGYVDFSTSDGTCTLGGNWAECHRDCNKCELYQDYLANKDDEDKRPICTTCGSYDTVFVPTTCVAGGAVVNEHWRCLNCGATVETI